jgi:hypothetical protein
MWSCNIWQEAVEERGMVSLNATCPRMHTEGVREMARRTRIKPAYPLAYGKMRGGKTRACVSVGAATGRRRRRGARTLKRGR